MLTHHHKDHCKKVTTNRLIKADTHILAPKMCIKELGKDITLVKPGDELKFGEIIINIVDAYNTSEGNSTKKVTTREMVLGILSLWRTMSSTMRETVILFLR